MDGRQQAQGCFPQGHYRELVTRYDPEQRAAWCYMRPASRPCCTPELLAELEHFHRSIEECVRHETERGKQPGLRFVVVASRIPGVFNLGGDLALFLRLIRSGDREALFHYAKACVDLLHVGYHLPITTISLVQGDAFGGGFEPALRCRVLIAERRAQMGLPEILFNLFPGMGALVARCYRAWHKQNPIHLEFRTEDGLKQNAPIVAARFVETDEGHMLLLWVRLEREGSELELNLEDDEDDEDTDSYPPDTGFPLGPSDWSL